MKNISKIPALDVSHLTVSYKNNTVLSDCTITVPQGVMLGIIGPNGAGKTTFLKSILELIPKQCGTVLICGESFTNMRKHIAYIPQRNAIDWDFPLTVFDMVLMGCYGKLGWFKRPSSAEKKAAHDALKSVGLENVVDFPIRALSGGQQQRAFMARALLQEADLYFLDEPFAGVDAPTEKIIIGLFKKLRDQGKTIIVVHHDMMTAYSYFDWALLLNKKVLACGPIETVLTQQNIARVYSTKTPCSISFPMWDPHEEK